MFAILYGYFFIQQTKRGLRSWFSGDDLTNLYYPWSHPVRELIAGNIVFFGHYPRPMGELVYYAMYRAFGFNAAGFNVARLLLCAVDVFVLYFVAKRLSGSRETGAFAVLLGGFHPALLYMYYDTGMIYDALAFLFCYGAFLLYMRSGNRYLVLVLALYAAALESKEIAVSFPFALLFYELTRLTPASLSARGMLRQFSGTLIAGMMTVAYIAGRTTGPSAMTSMPAYSPHYSFTTYLDSYSYYFSQFTPVSQEAARPLMPWILAGCIALALLLRNRVLIWAALFNIVTILPLAFIGARGGFECAVPFAGWAIYCAELIVMSRRAATFNRPVLRLPSQIALAVLLYWFILRPESLLMQRVAFPVVHSDQNRNREYYRQLRALLPANLSHKKVLALHDPYMDRYELLFLLALGYNDPTVAIETPRLLESRGAKVSPSEYDYVLDYADGQFALLPRSIT